MNVVDLLIMDNVGKFCEFKDVEYGDYIHTLIDYCDYDECYWFVDIETRDNLYPSDLDGYEFVGFVSESCAVSTVEEQYKCSGCKSDVQINKESILAVELMCSSCKSTEETIQRMKIQNNVYKFHNPCQLLILRSYFKGINNSNINDCYSGLFVINTHFGDFVDINHFTIIPYYALTQHE